MLAKYIYILFLCISVSVFGQEKVSNFYPKFLINYKDTQGTYVRVLNYFTDKAINENIIWSYKQDSIWLKKSLQINKENGLAALPFLQNTSQNIFIQDYLELKNVLIKENKINTIKIWDTLAFLYLQESKTNHGKNIEVGIWKENKTDTFTYTLPCKLQMPKGKYILHFNTTPPKEFSYYAKASELKKIKLNEEVEIRIMHSAKYAEIKVYKSLGKDKGYEYLFTQNIDEYFQNFYLQPFTFYKLEFRKKGKKKFKNYNTYIKPVSEYYNLILEK